MRTSRLLQAVTLLLVISVATSCAASKEYSSKLFGPRPVSEKDSQAVALRFLDLDKLESSDEGWVDTKIIKDSVWRENGEVIIAKQDPVETPKDSDAKETEPIAKSTNTNGTRNKTSREK
jgi:hypothetical protein